MIGGGLRYTRTIPAPEDTLRVARGTRVVARLYIYEVIRGRRVCHARPGDQGTILRVEDRRWPIVRFDGRYQTVRVARFEIHLL